MVGKWIVQLGKFGRLIGMVVREFVQKIYLQKRQRG